MKSTLPSRHNIMARFVVTYGLYIAVLLALWAYVQIEFVYIMPVIAVLCAVGYYSYRANVSILARAPKMSSDDFAPYIGTARTDIEDTGTVRIRGELWNARSETRIPSGSEVVVEDVEGLTLLVREKAPTEGA